MPATLTEINRFPVKSLRGEGLDEAVVEPWGLAGDRRWMVVDDDGEVITAREVNSMLLLRPRLLPDGLAITADQSEIVVARPGGAPRRVTVFASAFTATPAPEADDWFSEILGRPAHLVFLNDPTVRSINPAFSEPTDRVSCADGYPLLLATESSLAALNGWIAEGPNAALAPLPMRRFRPNLVVAGTKAWAEDGWRRIRVGDAVFRTPKSCDRCVMTTVDPDTARRSKEPIATLARHRRYDGATWFGMNLIPDNPGATVRMGDEVEVLDAVDPSNGPPH